MNNTVRQHYSASKIQYQKAIGVGGTTKIWSMWTKRLNFHDLLQWWTSTTIDNHINHPTTNMNQSTTKKRKLTSSIWDYIEEVKVNDKRLRQCSLPHCHKTFSVNSSTSTLKNIYAFMAFSYPMTLSKDVHHILTTMYCHLPCSHQILGKVYKQDSKRSFENGSSHLKVLFRLLKIQSSLNYSH